MALFDTGNTPNGKAPKTLEDVLGQQAQTATAQTQDQYTQARRRVIAQEGHMGRLGSGVSDYPLTDLDKEEGGVISGIQSNLEGTLGRIPSEDWMNAQQFNQSLSLADLIGSLNKPSTLEDVFGGIGAGARLGGTIAAFA